MAADKLDHKTAHFTKWFRSNGSRYPKSAGERKLESDELKKTNDVEECPSKRVCGDQASKLEPSLLEEVEF